LKFSVSFLHFQGVSVSVYTEKMDERSLPYSFR